MATPLLKSALNTAAHWIKNTVVAEFSPATRLICQLPDSSDGRRRDIVAEGKSFGKGSWNLYVQTLNPEGSRDIQDLFILPKSTQQVLATVSGLYEQSGNTDPFYKAEFLSKIREPLLGYLGKPRLEMAPEI